MTIAKAEAKAKAKAYDTFIVQASLMIVTMITKIKYNKIQLLLKKTRGNILQL